MGGGGNLSNNGEFIPIATNGGYNFWQSNHRFADGNDTFWPRVPWDDPEYRTMGEGDEWTKNREGYRYGLRYLLSHPGHWAAQVPTKAFWLFHTDTSGLYEAVLYAPETAPSSITHWLKGHTRRVESLTFRYYQAVLVLAAAVLCVPSACRWRIWPILCLPLLLLLFHLFFHAKDRFHVPLAPFFALLAAITLVRLENEISLFLATRMHPGRALGPTVSKDNCTLKVIPWAQKPELRIEGGDRVLRSVGLKELLTEMVGSCRRSTRRSI